MLLCVDVLYKIESDFRFILLRPLQIIEFSADFAILVVFRLDLSNF